jgi:hypothetical protein
MDSPTVQENRMTEKNRGTPTTSSPRWYGIWMHALWPSVTAFEGILRHRERVNLKTAFGWTVISALIAYAIAATNELIAGASPLPQDPFTFMVCVPLGVMTLAPFLLALTVTSGQWIALRLGGTGNLRQMAYAYAAFWAPLDLITALAASITDSLFSLSGHPLSPHSLGPVVWLSSGAYQVVLSTVATKAVHHFGWGRALVSTSPAIASIGLAILANLSLL